MKRGKFVDEKIILLKEVCRNRETDYNLLTDEIPIHKRRVRFQWFSLFDGVYRILLPENFMQMPEQIARIRYISSYRPPVILSGPNYDENFGFHLLKEENEEPDQLIRKMQDSVLRHAPETVFYDKGRIGVPKMSGRWFEYKNFTLDEETYNMQFIIQSKSDMLVGTFNCRMLFYDVWKPLVLKSLGQIEMTERGRGTNAGR